MAREKIALDGKWQFRIDPEGAGIRKKFYEAPLEDAEEVEIPHTVNSGCGRDDYRGPVWYQYLFTAPEAWADKVIRLQFDGVYRDADFWMNGEPAGQHYGAGFTTFTIDVTGKVKTGAENILTVRVDNSYSPYALPWWKEFDWADDGGIFRPVYILVTDRTAVEYAYIDALPEFPEKAAGSVGGRVEEGPATLRIRAKLLPGSAEDVHISYRLLETGSLTVVQEGALERLAENDNGHASDTAKAPGAAPAAGQTMETDVSCKDSGILTFAPVTISADIRYWHFDQPFLYDLELVVSTGDGADAVTDIYRQRIGFRQFTTDGNNFVLNGEKVSLVGTEWMPGSDPRIGNAERPEDLARFLRILKDSNCVYTRVHWQQDDAFYDWCDAHGLMVQEEVPLWGSPKEPVNDTMERVQSQVREMTASHYNHPSIVTWGVGNELDGQSAVTKDYVRKAVSYVHTVDPYRPVSYVSNSWWDGTGDAASHADIQMLNEYSGTWVEGKDTAAELRKYRAANPDKPMLISEFGLCEPVFPGGDRRREELFREKVKIYRENGIDGFIYFCLNDYRTQMGEAGEGRFRERVHGSTDFYGNPKPSYYAVREECSPVVIERADHCMQDDGGNAGTEGKIYGGRAYGTPEENDGDLAVFVTCRPVLPGYAVKHYDAVLTGENTSGALCLVKIPDLLPGETAKITFPDIRADADFHGTVRIFRPTGDCVTELELEGKR